jgi:PAS domain S-box-containing protein
MNDVGANAQPTSFRTKVADRFGVLPNFFCSASAAPGLIEGLWDFAQSAYLDSPLPSLFKERLFVHLSRFCPVRYCIVRHVGFLMGAGRPAGDPTAPPETVAEVMSLLQRPVPDSATFDQAVSRLLDRPIPEEIPAPETSFEYELFDVLTIIFLTPLASGRARQAMRTAVGATNFEYLIAYLVFIRAAHYWTETHPDIEYEPDMLQFMERHEELARLLLDPADADQTRGALERATALTALQESEERFRAVVDLVPDLLWRIAPGATMVWCNHQWLDYTGHVSPGATGQGWMDAIHPDDRDALIRVLEDGLNVGSRYHQEHRIRRHDDAFRWFLLRVEPVRDQVGRIVEWFAAAADIDDQKCAAEALQESNRLLESRVTERTSELRRALQALEAETANRAKVEEFLRQAQKMEAIGQLTGGLAHDFNNILTGIKGSLELLRLRLNQGRLSDLDRYFNTASAAADRATSLTQRLLAFARQQTLDAKAVRANDRISEIEDLIRRTIGPSITLKTALAPDLWLSFCDPNQLENAIVNLCINARDAMPDGGVLIIETANHAVDKRAARDQRITPGPYVLIAVSDTGAGMTPEVTARAFDPFFTTKPLGQGTGLGLSMIYGFVRQSGGEVRIRSEVGHGTKVSIYLPRNMGVYEQDIPSPRLDKAPHAERRQSVLVIDDEPSVRMLIVEVLDELGYDAIEAIDGPSALALLLSGARIDLLISDVALPNGMNGRQVAEAARQVLPGLKVLFITGYAENAALRGVQVEVGMQVMVKPFTLEALGSRINAMIGDD